MSAEEGGRTPGPLLAYDGHIPGPVLRMRQGEELNLRLFNDLPEPTSTGSGCLMPWMERQM